MELTADTPSVTLEHIESQIAQVFYYDLHDAAKSAGVFQLPPGNKLGMSDACVIIMKNGFVAHGVNHCINRETYSKEMGRKFAYDNAMEVLWKTFGYMLMQLKSEAA